MRTSAEHSAADAETAAADGADAEMCARGDERWTAKATTDPTDDEEAKASGAKASAVRPAGDGVAACGPCAAAPATAATELGLSQRGDAEGGTHVAMAAALASTIAASACGDAAY